MNSRLRLSLTCLTIGSFLLLLAAAPAFAQITFSDFSNASSLALNGSATTATSGNQVVLRLTTDGTTHKSGSAWFQTQQQSVASGFTSVFQFQITHANTTADGLAFVIQNSTGTGFGTQARGGSGGAIGYGVPDPINDNGSPIPDSVAVEFDTFTNSWDPNSNHIAVQSCGTDPNSQKHNSLCPNGSSPTLGINSSLGTLNLADGAVHTAIVEYDPGILRVFVDDMGTPLLTVNTDLSTLLSLNGGNAWVGFTGGVGAQSESNDILSWTFTPATAQTPITQTLVSDPVNPTDTNYVYGSYNHKLEYVGASSGDSVTVTAIPIDQATFHNTRLIGSPFPNADCVIYDGAGGLCVMFEVTCTASSNDCTGLDYTLFNNFNTSQTINGAGVLKAPIGTNTWANIIQSFTQTRNDPGSRSGSKGFSDFILVQNATAKPTITFSSPSDGSTFKVGDSITVEFACTPDINAPQVTTATCTGVLNGHTVAPGDPYTFTTADLGMGSIIVSATDSVMNSNSATATFNVGISPLITSGSAATFQTGMPGSFLVTTSGSPVPAIGESGALPSGVSFLDNGNGTATLGGTPAAGTGNLYNLVISATNFAGASMQSFALTVNQPPAITSANSASFTLGAFGSFTVTTTGYPTSAISETGALPTGVTLTDNNNGTATLSGTPTASGTFPITIMANNGITPVASQGFTLTVSGPSVTVTPSSLNFGTVKQYSLLWKNVTIKNVGTAKVTFSKIYVTPGQGADADDYTSLSFCGSSLQPGKSCLVTVFLFADDLGTLNATLNIADNAAGSPQQVSLTTNVIKRGH